MPDATPAPDLARDLARDLASAKSLVPLGSTWLHRRGERYFVVGHCAIAGYKTTAVLCRGQDGIVWCRPTDQFVEGRLFRIDDGPSGSPQAGTKPHGVTVADVRTSDLI
jgi:hypothetical protein